LDNAALMDSWLDLGNRAFDNQQQGDTFYQRHPTLAKYRTVAEDHSPISEIQQDYQSSVQSMSSPPASPPDLAEVLRQARSRKFTKAEMDRVQAEAPGRTTTLMPLPSSRLQIPDGWIRCMCPADHPNAGLLFDGVRYHTPLLRCPR